MEWMEINCIIDGSTGLVEEYQATKQNESLLEDDRMDLDNEMI
jgi:hypothetical protein